MKVLIVGSGAREHAIAWKLRRDDPAHVFFCDAAAGLAVLVPQLAHHLVERLRGECTGLGEDEHALTEGHQRRDGRDVRGPGERLLRLGVDLAEDDVLVSLGRLLVGRGELSARTAPGRPEVHEHDVVLGDSLLEVGCTEVDRCHELYPSKGV